MENPFKNDEKKKLEEEIVANLERILEEVRSGGEELAGSKSKEEFEIWKAEIEKKIKELLEKFNYRNN